MAKRTNIHEQSSASVVAILKAKQSVHDEAAIGLMKQAQKHLRAATAISRELSKLTSGEAAHAA